MPLNPSTLGSELANLTPTDSESGAISAFVGAWDTYFADASLAGVPANAGSYGLGLSAMESAMVGMSTTGAMAMQSGIIAFWTAILALPTAIWTLPPPSIPVPPIVPPLTMAGIAALLTPVFATNVTTEADAALAWQNIATVLHTNGGIGALVPVQVPPAAPIPMPIL